jgi:ABC-type transporter Mla subunit MlaD
MRFERDDAKIGVMVFIAIGVFMTLVFHRSLSAIFKKELIVKVQFQDIADVDIGTDVQLQGHRVGQVNKIVLKRNGVQYSYLATLGLRPDVVLWKGTRVAVTSKGLGSPFLNLELPPVDARKMVIEADAVLPGEAGASLGTLINTAQSFIENLNGTLNELRSHIREKGLGSILDHPNVRKVLLDLDSTLLSFRQVAVRGDAFLKHGQDSEEILDRSLISLDKSTAMIENILSKRSGDINDIIINVDSLMKELQSLSADMSKLLKDGGPEVEESLKSLHRNLKSMEELLEILKNKPSRIVWGTPSEAEKESARKRVESNSQQSKEPNPTAPEAPPPSTP